MKNITLKGQDLLTFSNVLAALTPQAIATALPESGVKALKLIENVNDDLKAVIKPVTDKIAEVQAKAEENQPALKAKLDKAKGEEEKKAIIDKANADLKVKLEEAGVMKSLEEDFTVELGDDKFETLDKVFDRLALKVFTDRAQITRIYEALQS